MASVSSSENLNVRTKKLAAVFVVFAMINSTVFGQAPDAPSILKRVSTAESPVAQVNSYNRVMENPIQDSSTETMIPADNQGRYQPGKGWRWDKPQETSQKQESRAKKVKTDSLRIAPPNAQHASAVRNIQVKTTNELIRALRVRGDKRILLAQGTYNLSLYANKFPVNRLSGSVHLLGASCESTKIIGPGTEVKHEFLQLGKGYGQVSIDRIGFENWSTVVRLLENNHDRISITNCCFSKIANTVGTYNGKVAHGGIEALTFRNNRIQSSRLFGINLIYVANSRLRDIDISKNVIENIISQKSEAVGIGLRAALPTGKVAFTTEDSRLNISDNTVHNVRKQLAEGATVVDGIIVDGFKNVTIQDNRVCLLYTSPSPRDQRGSRMPSSA